VKCTYCGWKNPATVTFCRKCGTQLLSPSHESTPISFPATDSLPGWEIEHEPRAKRKVVWRVFWIVLICLLIAGAGITWWARNTSQSTTAISQTLQTYCNALQSGDYQQAYNQWTSSTQMSEADFAYTQKNKAKITECEISTVSAQSSSAQASLTFFFADGSTAVDQISLVLENGIWKIKGQSLS
jgi:hypothetical protein